MPRLYLDIQKKNPMESKHLVIELGEVRFPKIKFIVVEHFFTIFQREIGAWLINKPQTPSFRISWSLSMRCSWKGPYARYRIRQKEQKIYKLCKPTGTNDHL